MEKLNIIFENENVLILNKQPYIFVYKKKEESRKKNTLVDFANQYVNKKNNGQKILPITSLNFEATGIVIFAKNEDTYKFISEQLKKEQVVRTYYILVNGIMESKQGKIEKNLLVTEQTTSISDKGVKAVTKYFVEEQFKNFALVKVQPKTSYKNQIRVHFWSAGNTLAVDDIYGSSEPILLSNLKRRYKGISKEKPLLKRLPVHLYQTEFLLPGEKEKRIFTAEMPDDMKVTVKQLRKYNL